MNSEILNKAAARLAAHSIFLHMTIGAISVALLVYLKAINSHEDMRIIIGYLSIPFVFFYILNWKCCKYFYGEGKYRSIMPKMGKNIGIPNKDSHFFQTIVSEISQSRKFSGYIYVISKFITCFFLGAMMMWAVIHDFLKLIV